MTELAYCEVAPASVLTVNVWLIDVAALYEPLPAWDAVIVVVPGVSIEMVFPETVATEGFELVYVMAKPELAVAVNENGSAPKVLAGRALNVIV